MKTMILQSRQRRALVKTECRPLPTLAGSVPSPYYRMSGNDRKVGRVNNFNLTLTMDVFIVPVQFNGSSGDAVIYEFWNAGVFVAFSIVNTTAGHYTGSVWHQVTVTSNGSGTITLYFDGLSEGSGTQAYTNTIGFITIGAFNTSFPTPGWDGKLDEARVENVARSADWAKADYNTSIAPDKAVFSSAGFYTVGAEQGGVTPIGAPIFATSAPLVIKGYWTIK